MVETPEKWRPIKIVKAIGEWQGTVNTAAIEN